MRTTDIAVISVVLMGCEPNDGVVASNGLAIEAEPVGVSLTAPTLQDPGRLLVRGVDARGISVGPGTAVAQIDGEPVEVELDARGYGRLTLDPGAYDLGGLGDAYAVAAAEPFHSRWGRAFVGLPTAEHVELASGGSLVAAGSEVWWVGPALPPHVVVRLSEGAIAGLRAVQIDDDGVIDAVVWGGSQVVLLRGRPEGGASWGAVIDAPGWEARGADARDIDGDGAVDLAVAWAGPDAGRVQVWAGDGLWAFDPILERTIAGDPLSLAVASDRGDGLLLTTVLTDDGSWQRLLRDPEGEWRLTGPSVQVGSAPGYTVRSGGDYTASGADNLLVVPPRITGEDRDLTLWSLDEDPPSFMTFGAPAAHVAVGDVEANGRPNVLLLEESSAALSYLTHIDGEARVRDVGIQPFAAPLGLAALDDDSVVDVLLGGEVWVGLTGGFDGEGEARWRPEPVRGEGTNLNLQGPIFADPFGDVFAITRFEQDLRLVRVAFDGFAPLPTDPVRLGPSEQAVVDVAACDGVTWVLTLGEVIALRPRQGVLARQAVAEPRAVACGVGPDGVRAAVIDGDRVLQLDAVGASLGRVDVGAAADVALLDRGAGPELVACPVACAAWTALPSEDWLVLAHADEVEVQRTGPSWSLPGGEAHLAVQDIDGDGVSELLWRWGERYVGVVRQVDGELTAPAVMHTASNVQGAPVAAGLASGQVDLWFRRDQDVVGFQ